MGNKVHVTISMSEAHRLGDVQMTWESPPHGSAVVRAGGNRCSDAEAG